jgi:uncharacterized repeat protein (TIGR03803 family)
MIHDFDGVDGDGPYAGLVLASDGNFYGTTSDGGPGFGAGTIFRMTPGGAFETLHTFHGNDGASSGAPLIQGADGALYGTTEFGGKGAGSCQYGCGVIFKITMQGAYSTLYRFSGRDGAYPYGGLVESRDGTLYGTTEYLGKHNSGTVFKLSPSGQLTTLHDFDGADGAYPFAALLLATDGKLYGTADAGGLHSQGTVFRITTGGRFTTLHSFNGNDGGNPRDALVQANDGTLYGTTEYGAYPVIYGTVFKITTDGTFTSLHTFVGTDGANPYAGLTLGGNGFLFGTTLNGGVNNDGSIYRISPNGQFTSVYSFQYSQAYPFAGLVRGTNGMLYGTTYEGGSNACGGFFCGMVFSLSIGESTP